MKTNSIETIKHHKLAIFLVPQKQLHITIKNFSPLDITMLFTNDFKVVISYLKDRFYTNYNQYPKSIYIREVKKALDLSQNQVIIIIK